MARAEHLQQFEAHERAYNKLGRTFAAQVEALRKHRNGGKQTVTVQHVSVADGGQAVVGNVSHRGRGKVKPDDNPMSKAHAAPRCTATSKRTGARCKGPAVKGWRVCRFHGAGGGHPPGKAHPSWKHGMRSREWVEERKAISELVREARDIERVI